MSLLSNIVSNLEPEIVFEGEQKDALLKEIEALNTLWSRDVLPRLQRAKRIRCVITKQCQPEAQARYGGRDWYLD